MLPRDPVSDLASNSVSGLQQVPTGRSTPPAAASAAERKGPLRGPAALPPQQPVWGDVDGRSKEDAAAAEPETAAALLNGAQPLVHDEGPFPVTVSRTMGAYTWMCFIHMCTVPLEIGFGPCVL